MTNAVTSDPFVELKKRQREMWAGFAPTATFTTPCAGELVKFAGLTRGQDVLDVATGTGVVAITAARAGARVKGLDLTPELVAQARENARIAGCANVEWTEGDAEQLPYPDASFDVVLSQFGHMFAPRPEVAVAEMRRVLRPNGRIAFSTWPPEHFIGKLFALIARHSPPPPPGASPPPQWGTPSTVAERLGSRFDAPFFARATMIIPALSLGHFRSFLEASVGPVQKAVQNYSAQPEKLAAFRAELEQLAEPYHWDNVVHQDFLMTRATAR